MACLCMFVGTALNHAPIPANRDIAELIAVIVVLVAARTPRRPYPPGIDARISAGILPLDGTHPAESLSQMQPRLNFKTGRPW